MCIKPFSSKPYIDYETGEMVDGRNLPCGKCIECLQKKRAHWSFRLYQEMKRSSQAIFLTLTYSKDFLPKDYSLNKKELQKYFKKVWHKARKLKYYAVGEYGSKGGRPHYHAIVFNVKPEILQDCWTWYDRPNDRYIDKGRVDCGKVNQASIHYVTKYIINDEDSKRAVPPFSISSRGIGANYAYVARDYHLYNRSTITVNEGGYKGSLPRYLVDKIFNTDNSAKVKRLVLDKKFYKEYGIERYRLRNVKIMEKRQEYFEALKKNQQYIKEMEQEILNEDMYKRKMKRKSKIDKAKIKSKSKNK